MGNFWGGFGQGFGPAFTGAWARASEKAERAAERKAELDRLAQLAQEERIAKALAYEAAGADVRSLPLVKDQLKGPWSRENMLEQQPPVSGVPFPTGDQAIGPLEEGAGPLEEGFERQAGIPAEGAFVVKPAGMPERPTGAALESLSRPELIATGLASEMKYAKSLKEEEREYGEELLKAKHDREAQLLAAELARDEAQLLERRGYAERIDRFKRVLQQAEDSGLGGDAMPDLPSDYTTSQRKETYSHFELGRRLREVNQEKLAFETAVGGLVDIAKNAALTGGDISLPEGVSANYELAWKIAVKSAMAAVENPELQEGKDKAEMVAHLTDFAKESGVGGRPEIVTGIASVKTDDHAKVVFTNIARTAENERTINNMMELGKFGKDITALIKEKGVSSMPLGMMEKLVANVDLVPPTTAVEKNAKLIKGLVKHLNEQETGSDEHKDAQSKLDTVLAIMNSGYEVEVTLDEDGKAHIGKKKTETAGPSLVKVQMGIDPIAPNNSRAIVYRNPVLTGQLTPAQYEEQTKRLEAIRKELEGVPLTRLGIGTGTGSTNAAEKLREIVAKGAEAKDFLDNEVTIDDLLDLAGVKDDDAKDELFKSLAKGMSIQEAKSFADLPPEARKALKPLEDEGITIEQFRKAILRGQK